MKRKLLAFGVSAALGSGLLATAASADPGIGQPTNPSCFGQFLSNGAQQFGGAKAFAEAYGFTVHEGHNVLRGFCGRTSGFVPTP